MSDTTAAFYDVRSVDSRVFFFRNYRRLIRTIGGGVAVGLGAVAAVGVLIAAVTLAAAWLVNTTLSANPQLQARALTGPATIALANNPTLAVAANLPGFADARGASFETKWARASGQPAAPLTPQRAVEVPERQAKPEIARAPASTQVAKLASAAAPVSAVPLPQPRPHPAPQEIAQAAPVVPPAPQIAAVVPPPPAAPAEKRVAPREAHNKSMTLPDPDSRTAVYDISARTVYLPNGEKLEAHSGLYDKLDDPRYVNVKMRGPTPPNVYDLTLREALFHGVRAIRLNPVDEGKMFGRAGMLAHTYMLGPNGDSNGCVSFKDYNKFLQAFLRGEVDRLVVVPDGGTKLALTAGRRRGPVDRYAANNPPVERNMNAW